MLKMQYINDWNVPFLFCFTYSQAYIVLVDDDKRIIKYYLYDKTAMFLNQL